MIRNVPLMISVFQKEKRPYAMTNAILPGMTHSETPHPAPTPGFGAASRVGEDMAKPSLSAGMQCQGIAK